MRVFSFCFVACGKPVDLLFIVEGGELSIKENFIQSIADKFLGENDTLIGVVALGLSDDLVLPLDALESFSSFNSHINSSLPSIAEFLRPDFAKVGCSIWWHFYVLFLLLRYGFQQTENEHLVKM